MGLSDLPASELAAWVEASCRAQGVPMRVTDVTVVRRVGTLLGVADEGRAQARSAARPSPGTPS